MKKLKIEDIKLDFENPRIVRFLEIYNTDIEKLDGQAISLALGSGGNSDEGATGYQDLKDSIRTSNGIIHPIIVNHNTEQNKYVVIEGNTRVQIYKELAKDIEDGRDTKTSPETWKYIPAIVYDDLPKDEIEMIRLQAHLVGPREWDAYSKAKYLHKLYHIDKMPMSQLISYCGGK